MTLATLSDAIDWARDRWAQQRTVPTRLHTREEEGVGLGFTPAFRVALDGKPNHKTLIETSETCGHWQRRLPDLCPDCAIYDKDGRAIAESGLYKKRTYRYTYPMSLALHKLRLGLASRRHPHPYGLVIVLAAHGWLPQQAARALEMPWDRAEALFLMALRRLHNYYSEGPVDTRTYASRTVGWLEMSDSQRAAIEAGETAA